MANLSRNDFVAGTNISKGGLDTVGNLSKSAFEDGLNLGRGGLSSIGNLGRAGISTEMLFDEVTETWDETDPKTFEDFKKEPVFNNSGVNMPRN